MKLVTVMITLGMLLNFVTPSTAFTASALIEIAKPTGVKVKAAFRAWESYLTPTCATQTASLTKSLFRRTANGTH